MNEGQRESEMHHGLDESQEDFDDMSTPGWSERVGVPLFSPLVSVEVEEPDDFVQYVDHGVLDACLGEAGHVSTALRNRH